MSTYSVASNFNQYFKIKFANTQELKEEAFKIRYGVYCSELGWEPENDKEIETDEYDEASLHCLLEHRRTGDFAGCVRLIVPPKNNPNLQLPFEQVGLEHAYNDVVDVSTLKRRSFGEVSRLAVLNKFRRREKEKNTPFILKNPDPEIVYTEEERRNFPNIAMGLYLAAVSLSEICNHVGMFVMMEPRLNRRLQRFGLPFKQVGAEVDYHGIRAMFMLPSCDFNSQLTPELLELYDIINRDLREQISDTLVMDNFTF